MTKSELTTSLEVTLHRMGCTLEIDATDEPVYWAEVRDNGGLLFELRIVDYGDNDCRLYVDERKIQTTPSSLRPYLCRRVRAAREKRYDAWAAERRDMEFNTVRSQWLDVLQPELPDFQLHVEPHTWVYEQALDGYLATCMIKLRRGQFYAHFRATNLDHALQSCRDLATAALANKLC